MKHTKAKPLYKIHYLVTGQEMHVQDVSCKLTYTGLDALRPSVISISVAGTSTALVPGTTRSATTDLAGFLEGAAL